MFQMLSEGYALDVMTGSLRLSYTLAALLACVIVVHYIAVWGYQWVNDTENETGSRWLLFKYTPFDGWLVDYVGVTLLGLLVLPFFLAFLIAAIITVPWLFALIMSLLAIMKLTRGIVRLKKKLNAHINDNEAHKEN